MRFELVSPLPLAECVRRLRAATDGRWAIGGSKPVLGFVGDKSVRLRWREELRQGSFWASEGSCWVSADFVEEFGWTRLHGRTGLHPMLRGVLEIWIGGVLVLGGLVLFGTVRTYLSEGVTAEMLWLGIAFPLVLLTLGVILLFAADYFPADEPRFLIEFIARTIEGHEA
jgi:hypothetical protein